jgi:hypothetical protein
MLKPFCILLLAVSAAAIHAASFTVTSNLDRVPTNETDRADGTFRQAILDANATADPHTIVFNLASPHIAYTNTAPMPEIFQPVIINGFNQNGGGRVELVGTNANFNSLGALVINAGNSTVRGLVINRFPYSAIILRTNGNNVIEGNYLGTDFTGSEAQPNHDYGVYVFNCPSNTIGGLKPESRNVISGNEGTGVHILRRSAAGNRVLGNFIGTDSTGTKPLPNGTGVSIYSANSNIVGGVETGAANVISGNLKNGLDLSNLDTQGNIIVGNFIGTDLTGTTAVPNGKYGIQTFRVSSTTIGGTTQQARNIISGNRASGIVISQPAAAGSRITGNFIGTDISGKKALPNGEDGVLLSASYNNTVGGLTVSERNVISGNSEDGITLIGAVTTNNIVQGNFIGTDSAGLAPLPNTFDGVTLEAGASLNVIGGSAPGARNVISGNGEYGVALIGADTAGNRIEGNSIGTDLAGTVSLGNAEYGVYIDANATHNSIGGLEKSGANLIVHNLKKGVVADQFGNGNAFLGNSISDNRGFGIDLSDDALPDNALTLTSANSSRSGTTIAGSLKSAADSTFRIEIFANAACSPTGYGEGERFIEAFDVQTDGSGQVAFNVVLQSVLDPGKVITATATSSAAGTTEFSKCVSVGGSTGVALAFQRTGDNFIIAWPKTATGYIVEVTSSIAPPVKWTKVDITPTIVGDQNQVTITTGAGTQFFRLKQ